MEKTEDFKIEGEKKQIVKQHDPDRKPEAVTYVVDLGSQTPFTDRDSNDVHTKTIPT